MIPICEDVCGKMTRVTVCVDVVQGEAVADRDGEPAVVRPDNLDVGEKGAVE